GGSILISLLLTVGSCAVAVLAAPFCADLQRRLISAQRDVQRARRVESAERAGLRSHSAGPPRRREIRRRRDDVDDPAVRILSEQRALRPVEHLDALRVCEIDIVRLGATEIDAVDVDADTGTEGGVGVLLADATNVDLARAAAGLRFLAVEEV